MKENVKRSNITVTISNNTEEPIQQENCVKYT